MRNLQLGILFSIAKTSKALQGQGSQPLSTADFKHQVRLFCQEHSCQLFM